ncbi:MAG TPA: hypothetical protein VGN98_12765 [Tianweitania sediminis]|nr:hypothetical protein [Tianweitania sediminis]
MRGYPQQNDEASGHEALVSALGSAMVRFALLFSTAGVALALFLAPMVARDERTVFARGAALDYASTGSIGAAGSYTIRRSVLSKSPNAVCVIRANGSRNGDC